MVIRLFHESDVHWMMPKGVSETTDHRRKFLSVFQSVFWRALWQRWISGRRRASARLISRQQCLGNGSPGRRHTW